MNSVIAAALGPPILIGITAFGILFGAIFGVHPLWNEPELTMAEAAALKDRGTIQRLIWEGVDPDQRARVRAGVLEDDEMYLTPLEASIGTRTPATMEFLLARGARMDDRMREVLVCLAIKEEAREILEFLKAGEQDASECAHVATPW